MKCNASVQKRYRRRAWFKALGFGMAVACSAASAEESTSAASAFWGATAANLNFNVVDSLYSFGLTALGFSGGDADSSADLASALQLISGELTAIETSLNQLDSDVRLENCNLDEAESVSAAVSHIRSVARDYNTLLTDGGTTAELQDWVNEVFNPSNDQTNSISQNLVTINTALMPAGSSGTGVIASCVATMAKPSSGQLDDTTYYGSVQALMAYFYAVQAEGMAALAEAYHYKAYQSWLAANPNAKVDPTQASSICVNATGDVLTECKKANTSAQEVYMDLQDEFAYAGIGYSTSQYKILNGTNYLFVLSLEDFAAEDGYNCTGGLVTVTVPCGPTAVASSQAATRTAFYVPGLIGVTFQYGYYNQWTPVSTSVMNSLFGAWTNSSQTLADYMTGLGFKNTANKIIFTPQTTSIMVQPIINSYKFYPGTAVCFADTRLSKSHGAQPFCSNLSAFMDDEYNDYGCDYLKQASWVPSGSSDNNFYQFVYETGSNNGWNEKPCVAGFQGEPPGYMAEPMGTSGNSVQPLWPYLDVSTLSCTNNADGTTRGHTNPSGVPKMCGSDFDTWFVTIVTKPPSM